MEVWFFLLLPVAAYSGWLVGRRSSNKTFKPKFFSRADFDISKQPDPAIDTLVRMPEVDEDSVDTHLTLGNVFRKRGELERAIRLHQGLLSRNTLSSQQKSLAQLELARDYLAAGVLDRAEALLLELVAHKIQLEDSLQHLLDLYQQGSEWLSAIKVAEQMQELTGYDLRAEIAHFYCELAEEAIDIKDLPLAKKNVGRALRVCRQSVRALILRAKLEKLSGNLNKAIKIYKHIASKDIDYFSLIINDLIDCYKLADVTTRAFDFVQDGASYTRYRCDQCGFTASKLQWHCPSCRNWDVIKPIPAS